MREFGVIASHTNARHDFFIVFILYFMRTYLCYQVERFDDDWARLSPALALDLASVPPRQRALAHVLRKPPTAAGAVHVLPHWREFVTEASGSSGSDGSGSGSSSSLLAVKETSNDSSRSSRSSSSSSSSGIPPGESGASTDRGNHFPAGGNAAGNEFGSEIEKGKFRSANSGLEYAPPYHDQPAEHFNTFHVLLVCRRYIQVLP